MSAPVQSSGFYSIHSDACGSEWSDFVDGIKRSVENRTEGAFPYAKMNGDKSVSFFLSKDDIETDFEKKLKADFIVGQIDMYRQRLGIQTIGNKLLFESIETEYVREYRFNVSPEDLDTILKYNSKYSGYKGENSLLKLSQGFDLSPDYIRLFPVYPLSDEEYMIRAAGCQMVEMPSRQLLQLVNGKETYLHYMHKEVETKFSLTRDKIETIINMILRTERRIYLQSDGDYVIPTPHPAFDYIRVVDMDEKTLRFYQMYGNCGEAELRSCKSFEVRTKHFLESVSAEAPSATVDELLAKS
jgi:hypothetical protein